MSRAGHRQLARGCAKLLSGALLAIALHACAAAPLSGERVPAPSAATPQALAFACREGIPGLAFGEGRARVMVEGETASALAMACADAAAVTRIDIAAPHVASKLLRIHAFLTGHRAHPRVESARALARQASRAGRPYDLIALTPEPRATRIPELAAVVPRLETTSVEGLGELLAAIAPNGALFALLEGEPAALRYAATAIEALRAQGVAAPAQRVVVQEAAGVYGVLASRSAIPLERVLQLHARDRERREGPPAPPVASLPRWAGSQPSLLHAPGVAFPNRFSRALVNRSARGVDGLATYVFDTSPVVDDRPLSFELTRRDRPDTWTRDDPYRHALLLAGLALLSLIAMWFLATRFVRSAQSAGGRVLATAALLGLAQASALAWTAHVLTRALASVHDGVRATLLGAALGLGAALWAARAQGRARPRSGALAQIAAFVLFTLIAGAAAASPALVAEMAAMSIASAWMLSIGFAALVAAATLPATRALFAGLRVASANARTAAVTCHFVGLVAALAFAQGMVLFVDFRAVAALATATGLVALALARGLRDAP